MQSIQSIQEEIIEEFSVFDDWMDKYAYLIEVGNGLAVKDIVSKEAKYLIEGCQSKVWLHAENVDGKVYYGADSDAIIVKGIVALLIRVLDGQRPDDIVNAELFFIEKIGLQEHLSPTRSNGLLAMVKQMKLYALAFQVKASQ